MVALCCARWHDYRTSDSPPPTDDGPENWCSAFPTDEARDAYAASVSPRRELVCPITQECYWDPVVAADGHTYERTSVLRWFHLGRNRSPVTNELMDSRNLIPNRAIATISLAHREHIGEELLRRCRWIRQTSGRCDDMGNRIKFLLDAGADMTLRDSSTGETPLMHLIRSGRADLVKIFLGHDPPVLAVGNDGTSAADAAEQMKLRSEEKGIGEWSDLVSHIKMLGRQETEREEARLRSRENSNRVYRQRQRELTEQERERTRPFPDDRGASARGLGSLQEGWGYFPSLAALQFQGSIPAPPPSVADWEGRERKRLDFVLRTVASALVLYLLFC